MSLTPQWLDELRARTTLSALIGRSIKVTKAGREFKACCPFHNEKTPSFTINDEKGFYHCLAAETVVQTAAGRVPIAELSGKISSVVTRGGRWVDAKFKEYGEQRLWKISLSRNGLKKHIFATSGHRWFVHDRVSAYLTTDLRPGHALQSASPKTRDDWVLDPEGIRHGIVFGDGTMYKGVYGTLNLHGEKDSQLRHWFPSQEHHVHERAGGALYLRIYGGRAFENMKALPATGASEAYLLGFLAGYLAADGHVAKDGTVMLNSSKLETLETVRDICTSLGIATYGRTTLMRKGYGNAPSALHRIHFVNASLSAEMFLLKEAQRRFSQSSKKFARMRWVVRAVEQTDRTETVYCAEVPQEHAFVLEDNILTGNCFGCSAHGDAIRWMTDQRGLSFMDAVKELADAAGMQVPAADPKAAAKAERANTLYDVMTAAQDWFVTQFQGLEGAEARAYCEKRGLKVETLKAFGIGFAPDSRSKLKEALASFGTEKLVESGLLIAVEDKEPYDRFRGRLMIPIRDPRGRVIAFGGRILGAGEPKYLNSPDTPLFDKGRTLYNLDKASPASRASNRVIVVEGYMDAIALAQAGFNEAVAPLGTALTEQQIMMLWRMVPKPLLCFDGDSAGQKAALRAAGRALGGLKPGHSLDFVTLPDGQDPDDVVKSAGPGAFRQLLEQAEPLVERLWKSEVAAGPIATPEDRAGLKQRLGSHLANIADSEIRHHYADAFTERFDRLFAKPPRASFQPRKNIKGGYKAPRPTTNEARSIGAHGSDLLVQGVLSALLNDPAQIMRHHESLANFTLRDPAHHRLLGAMLAAIHAKETLDSGTLLTILGGDLYNVAQSLLSGDGSAFAFVKPNVIGDESFSAGVAVRGLDEAIQLMRERPQLETALMRATEAASSDLTDESYALQQRLRAEKEDFDRRLAALFQRDDII